jgi:hypothetical protein
MRSGVAQVSATVFVSAVIVSGAFFVGRNFRDLQTAEVQRNRDFIADTNRMVAIMEHRQKLAIDQLQEIDARVDGCKK